MSGISKFLNDLYRDLRDRRLLLPALALAVGVLAVPFALSKSQSAPPPPPSAAGQAQATAAQPAVLAEEIGIRNYRQRLEAFKAENPFKQQFKLPEVTSSALEDVPASGEVEGGSAAGATSTSATSSETTSSGSLAGETPSSEPTSEVVTRRVTRLVSRRIDVKVGPEGDVEEIEGLGGLEVLPDEDTPVVAFLGVSDDGRRAAFLLSADVSATSGEGKCSPSPADCQYVALREHEEQTFDYAPDGLTYRLKLDDIRNVKLRDD